MLHNAGLEPVVLTCSSRCLQGDDCESSVSCSWLHDLFVGIPVFPVTKGLGLG